MHKGAFVSSFILHLVLLMRIICQNIDHFKTEDRGHFVPSTMPHFRPTWVVWDGPSHCTLDRTIGFFFFSECGTLGTRPINPPVAKSLKNGLCPCLRGPWTRAVWLWDCTNCVLCWETGLYGCNHLQHQPGHQSIAGSNQVTISIVGGKPRKFHPCHYHKR